MKKPQTPYLIVILLTIVFFGCKNKQDPQPSSSGILELQLHTYLEQNKVDSYNEIYTIGGRKVSMDMAQMYISNIQLITSDGKFHDLKGVKLLKVLDQEIYTIDNAPIGDYLGISLFVGLDSATNLHEPAESPYSSILNRADMWLNASSAQPLGYVFLNFQGKIDTSVLCTGSINDMQPFVFKIGTDSKYANVIMNGDNFSIGKDQKEVLHINIDYYELFNQILANQPSKLFVTTYADQSSASANLIWNEIPNVFSYKK